MRQSKVTPLFLSFAVLAGCSQGGKGGSPNTPSASTASGSTSSSSSAGSTQTSTTGLSVASFDPKTGAASTTKSLTIGFSDAVEGSSLVSGKTWVAVEDDDATAGGNYHVLQGSLDLDASGTKATFTPRSAFTADRDVRVILTSGVVARSGGKLEWSAVASEPVSFTSVFPDQVFEGRFVPTTKATTPPPSSGSTTGVIPPPTQPPTTPPPAPSSPGAFEIVRATPSANASEAVPTSIFLEFSNPVDKTTIHGGSGSTIGVLQSTNNPSTMSFPQFGIRWLNNDTMLEIVPNPLFSAGQDLFVILSSNVTDVNGKALTTGKASSALSKKTWLSSEVFELRITPKKVPFPQVPTDPSVFKLETGTDPWLIDFDVRGQSFAQDMDAHGLLSGDAATDKLAKDRIVCTTLAFMSLKYGRTADGKSQSGAWKISFTATRPSTGTPGKDYSREAVGGVAPSNGTLGISNMDTGNVRKDDNATSGQGLFTAGISGGDSKLNPGLTAADKKFLDGSYTIGQGSSTDDERMKRVLAVIQDWGIAIGSVGSHEVGHSVGLQHYNDRLSIMDAAATSSQLSEPRQYFEPPSAQVLDQTLGRVP